MALVLAFGIVLLVCVSLSGVAARTVLSTALLFLGTGLRFANFFARIGFRVDVRPSYRSLPLSRREALEHRSKAGSSAAPMAGSSLAPHSHHHRGYCSRFGGSPRVTGQQGSDTSINAASNRPGSTGTPSVNFATNRADTEVALTKNWGKRLPYPPPAERRNSRLISTDAVKHEHGQGGHRDV